jgi:E3 ubiquitin-protein ligase UBR4
MTQLQCFENHIYDPPSFLILFKVFKKVWVAEGAEGDVMRVVYRMRGLLGDATEEFVETLDAKSEQEVNNEEVYKMANVMADCGGLQVCLNVKC